MKLTLPILTGLLLFLNQHVTTAFPVPITAQGMKRAPPPGPPKEKPPPDKPPLYQPPQRPHPRYCPNPCQGCCL
ncbi:hypothetical protein MJO29_012682 [Puccinia striiformis f. sp. tritici]|nr:hypothetical protein MJO29_012682 [Puccinia striiformis f. sp. tritici]